MVTFHPLVPSLLYRVLPLTLTLLLVACGRADVPAAGSIDHVVVVSTSPEAQISPPPVDSNPSLVVSSAPPMEELLNLSALDSYRVRLFVTDGSEDIISSDAAWSSAGTVVGYHPAVEDDSETFATKRVIYRYSPKVKTCEANYYDWRTNKDAPDSDAGMTDEFIGMIKRWRLVEQGVLRNGVVTDHYVVEAATFPAAVNPFLMQDETSAGEAWVALDGSYLVHYVAHLTLDDQLLGQMIPNHPSGTASSSAPITIRWEYSITDINNVHLTLPAACEHVDPENPIMYPINYSGGPQDPCPTDAQCFDSPDLPSDVVVFYRDTYVPEGWTVDERTEGTATILTFTKDARALAIGIQSDTTPPYTQDEHGNPYQGAFVWMSYAADQS